MNKKILSVVSGVIGGALGAAVVGHTDKKLFAKTEEKCIKMTEFYHILERWLFIKQENRSLSEYFEQNGYKTIAIYGMKELGERLYDELNGTSIEVKYAIDKNAEQIIADFEVVTPQNASNQVDAVVVTAVHYFNDIESELSQTLSCPIISLEDIVYELV